MCAFHLTVYLFSSFSARSAAHFRPGLPLWSMQFKNCVFGEMWNRCIFLFFFQELSSVPWCTPCSTLCCTVVALARATNLKHSSSRGMLPISHCKMSWGRKALFNFCRCFWLSFSELFQTERGRFGGSRDMFRARMILVFFFFLTN